MNVRRVNFAMWTAAALMTAAALAVIALAVFIPARVDVRPIARTNVPAASRATDDAVLALASYEPVWTLELRKPLNGEAAPAVATAPVTPAQANNPAAMTLVGTIGDTLALIQTQAGVIEVKAVGESIGGAKILAVRPSEVDLEAAGQTTTLKKPKTPDGR